MRLIVLTAVAAGLVAGQTAGPALRVDVQASRRPISRDIYGLNEYGDADGQGQDTSMIGRYPFTVRRWGGDNSVSYNWQLDSNNTASNWYFETFPLNLWTESPAEGTSFDRWVARNQAAGIRSVATVPIIGWTTATREPKQCSYSVVKYGPQQKTDQWAPDCGNGVSPDGKSHIRNDPRDVYAEVGPEFAESWVAHVVERFGTAENGGVWLWELDNEPTWWHAVHRDIHPEPATFDEVLDRNIRWAEAIKKADPSAKVGGPTPPGWESYFYSARDLVAGWNTGPDWKFWNNPADCKEHSPEAVCMGFLPWYLDRMREYEERTGTRLLDYLDIHAYVGPDGLPGEHDPDKPEMDTLRLVSTRTWWDPDYMPPREDMRKMDEKYGTGTPRIVRRMRSWIDEHYPGTRLAITEYNWGAHADMTGALAQADLLGIFGREGVDLATVWGNPKPEEPAAFAWRMFLDYDGEGRGFGETSVLAETEDPDSMSVFAAERADGTLTVLVINKSDGWLESTLTVDNFRMPESAERWQYGDGELTRIVRLEDIPVVDGQIRDWWPPRSMKMLVLTQRPQVEEPVDPVEPVEP
jgi:hypothetical protein